MKRSGLKMIRAVVAYIVGVIAISLVGSCQCFAPAINDVAVGKNLISSTTLQMGLFDGLKKAFENQEYAAPPEGTKASARHILVKSAAEANEIMEKMGSSTFGALASEYSTCPSSARGGSLGSFGPGTMVPAFDKVIFDPETKLGEVVGPVQTQFGYHLIVVDKRTGV